MVIIFGFPTIENPRFDITHYFLWYTPSSPPSPPPSGAPLQRLGYPKLKMKIIIEIPTIENPRIDVSHVFYCVFLIFAVTAAAAADAADRTEKLPLLGVVLLEMNHNTKNQPDPLINVATAPFLGFWVPRLQMCHKITPPLPNFILYFFYRIVC